MKLRELKTKKILVKYGPLENPDKYTIDVLKYYKENVYDRICNRDYPIEDTEISYASYLSRVPYSETDRATMPPEYLCMGSLSVAFQAPSRSISPFAFVDFWHTTAKRPHHNTYVYWRKPDDSTKDCYSKDIDGHDEIPLEEDIVVSLTIADEKVFQDTIPGKKKED